MRCRSANDARRRGTTVGEETDREIALMTRRMTERAKQVTLLDEADVLGCMQREIGALRVGTVRLLMEEESPSKMAHALAKLSFALERAMQIQEGWDERDWKMRKQRQLLDEYNQMLAGARDDREKRTEPKGEPSPVEYKPVEWPPVRVSYEGEGEFEG